MRCLTFLLFLPGVAMSAVRIDVKPGDNVTHALEKAREFRRAQPEETIELVFADGIHRLTAPLVLRAEDSGTTKGPLRLIAAEGAKPVLSGGRAITGFRVDERGRWQAKVDGPAFEQLWVNGRRAIRAREPDSGFFRMKAVKEETSDSKVRQTVTLDDDALHWLRDAEDGALSKVQMLAYHKWDNTRRFIDSVGEGSFVTTGDAMKAWNQWDPKSGLVFENLEAGLDQPGEWFLSPDGLLTYLPRPGEDPATADVVAPVADRFFVIDGRPHAKVQYVELRGLAFRHAGWICRPAGFEPCQAAATVEAVIQIDHADHITIADCEVGHTGLYGIWFRDGCHDCRVERSLLHDLGAGGVRIGSLETKRDTGGQHLARLHPARRRQGLPLRRRPLGRSQPGQHRPSQRDQPLSLHRRVARLALGLRGRRGEAEPHRGKPHPPHRQRAAQRHGRHLHARAIGRHRAARQPHPRHRLLRLRWLGPLQRRRQHRYLVRKQPRLSHHHRRLSPALREGERHPEQHLRLRPRPAAPVHPVGRPPVVPIYGKHRSLGKGHLWGGGSQGRGNFECDRNLYWRTDGGEIDSFGKSLADWRNAGHDVNSIVADPGFIDPAKGDFRFKDPAIAAKIGFQPFDPSQAGVRGGEAWKDKAREVPPEWPQD